MGHGELQLKAVGGMGVCLLRLEHETACWALDWLSFFLGKAIRRVMLHGIGVFVFGI